MRTTALAGLLALAALPGAARAESSVAIFGVLDVGTNVTNNVGGSRLTRLEQRHEPSVMGFRGREDLGDGLEAIFLLEGSVGVDVGTYSPFDKQSYVGLSDKKWGTVTLGRNHDSIFELMLVDPPRYNSVSAVHGGNLDRTAGQYLNNSVRYRTPTVNGFLANVVYSFPEDGSSPTNAGHAGGANIVYAGSSLRVAAAFLEVQGLTIRPYNALGISSLFNVSFAGLPGKTIQVGQRIAGMGAADDVAGWRLLGEFTATRLSGNGVKENLKTVAVGVAKDPNTGPGFRPSVGAEVSTLNDSRWTTAFAIADYYFSKRTDVYLRVIGQRASGPNNQKAALFLEGPSSTGGQVVYGFGMAHRF